MTKQEFLDFCHEEFTKRGFTKKRKNMYYLQGKDFLCGLYLQKSMADAYYINCDYFFSEFSCTKYPTTYEADWSRRLVVLSKDTINGEHFMGAMWCYEDYIKEEMLPYLEKEFDEHVMPALMKGKKYLIPQIEASRGWTAEEKVRILEKLRES